MSDIRTKPTTDAYRDGFDLVFGKRAACAAPGTEVVHTRSNEMDNKQIARVCHEVNRAYCQALGDTSQPAWDDAPQWQKDSAMLGVELHITNHEAGPQASHESWMKQKIEDGWTYGPVKDPALKQHPCLVPFAELPREQQAKDFIFRAVVVALREE